MITLNNGISLPKEAVDETRKLLLYELSSPGHKDAAEFYQWSINDLYAKRRLIENIDPMLVPILAHRIETSESKRFAQLYLNEINEEIRCKTCSSFVKNATTQECILTVPDYT